MTDARLAWARLDYWSWWDRMTDYERYMAWAGDDPMPESVFAIMRGDHPEVRFELLHRWWLTPPAKPDKH